MFLCTLRCFLELSSQDQDQDLFVFAFGEPRLWSGFTCSLWREERRLRLRKIWEKYLFVFLAGNTNLRPKEDTEKSIVIVLVFGEPRPRPRSGFTCLFSFWWEEQRLRLRKIWFEESIWYYSRFWREMFRPRARSRSLLFFSLWREELTENKEDTGFVWDSVCYSCFLVGNTKIKTEIWYFAFWREEFIPRSRLRFVLCSGGAIWRNAVKIVVVFSSFVYCKNQDRPKS